MDIDQQYLVHSLHQISGHVIYLHLNFYSVEWKMISSLGETHIFQKTSGFITCFHLRYQSTLWNRTYTVGETFLLPYSFQSKLESWRINFLFVQVRVLHDDQNW